MNIYLISTCIAIQSEINSSEFCVFSLPPTLPNNVIRGKRSGRGCDVNLSSIYPYPANPLSHKWKERQSPLTKKRHESKQDEATKELPAWQIKQ